MARRPRRMGCCGCSRRLGRTLLGRESGRPALVRARCDGGGSQSERTSPARFSILERQRDSADHRWTAQAPAAPAGSLVARTVRWLVWPGQFDGLDVRSGIGQPLPARLVRGEPLYIAHAPVTRPVSAAIGYRRPRRSTITGEVQLVTAFITLLSPSEACWCRLGLTR
jgi:hypothetical protein